MKEKRYFIYSPRFGWFHASGMPAAWQPDRQGASVYQERYVLRILRTFHDFGEEAFAVPA